MLMPDFRMGTYSFLVKGLRMLQAELKKATVEEQEGGGASSSGKLDPLDAFMADNKAAGKTERKQEVAAKLAALATELEERTNWCSRSLGKVSRSSRYEYMLPAGGERQGRRRSARRDDQPGIAFEV